MNRGFTLVEIVVYLSLFSMVFVLTMPIFVEQNYWRAEVESGNDSLLDYIFIKSVIESAIKDSEIVFEPDSNELSEMLSVEIDGGRALFFLRDGSLLREIDGVEILLHSTSTRVDGLNFFITENSGFESLLMNIEINGTDFGTTSFLLK